MYIGRYKIYLLIKQIFSYEVQSISKKHLKVNLIK